MTTIAERVAAGAALLDERDPGWWRTVRVAPLGSHLHKPLDIRQLNVLPKSASKAEVAAHGYWHAPGLEGYPADAEVTALATEWHRVITERRAAA